MSIQSFKDKDTRNFFLEGKLKKGVPWSIISSLILRKLDMLHYAESLEDLNSPPGNRLELLKGELLGLYSIRANAQWRVVFKWTELGPIDVAVIDYH